MLKKTPDALVIISVVLVLFAALTWFIPAGAYQRVEVEGQSVVLPGTYTRVDAQPQGLGALLMAPIKGLTQAAHIIAFILLIGGSFALLSATGAIEAGLFAVLRLARKRPAARHLIIPLLMLFFSLAGCTFGMSEETLVFILITIPLARSMGYDSLVGVAIPFIGAGAGFSGAAINPFTVGIAQGIAELPIGSGAGYRWLVWAVFTGIAIFFVMRYARKIELRPERAFADANGATAVKKPMQEVPFTPARKLVLIAFLLSIVLLMYGANKLGWYIDEISALFLALGLLSAALTRMSASRAVAAFTEGARDMLLAALVVGMSRAALVLAEDGRIIDTILYGLSGIAQGLPNYLSVQVMFAVQGFINVFIPSGSGQAAITMPIMTPLADILGIHRQTAVLAFQFGDGLVNLIIPTSGITMGALAIAGIPFGKWLKWIWPLMLAFFVAGALLLAAAELYPVWPG